MLDTIIKICLFCSIPALVDHWVYRATGAPLDQSLWWWLRNFGEAPKLILAFGILAALTFAGFAYGVTKDLYQSVVGSPQPALFLGYRDYHEHYLVTEGGQSRPIDIHHPGPGEFRLDRVHQPATIMYNPLSQLYWPLKETRNTALFAFLAAVMLVFVLATFGYLHALYMDKHALDLLGDRPAKLGETSLVPSFMRAMYSYAVSNAAPFLLLLVTLVGGLALQSQRWKSESERLTQRQVPASIKPGAMLTATLVDTFSETVSLNRHRIDEANSKTRYHAIFEIAGVYPHPVWVASYLGSNLPMDKDDGVYPSLDDELEKRTDYEDAKPLAETIEKMKTSRPQLKVRLTENLTLDWTVEPRLSLQEIERAGGTDAR